MSALLETFQRYRITFIACNAGLLVLAIGALAPIYQFVADRDIQIAEKQNLLVRFQAMAAREPDVQAAARQPDEQADHGEFLSGPNENVVSADLQTRLKSIVDRNGVRIRTMQSQPAKVSGALVYVGAQLTIYGALQRIQAAIYEVESSKPCLIITNATIRLLPSGGPGNSSAEPVIEARLDVAGAMPDAGARR